MMQAFHIKFIDLVNDHSFNPVDGTAFGVGFLSWVKWLPDLSAGLAAIWMILRIVVFIRDEFLKKDKKNGNE
jgi:hypothetical protein